MFKSSTAERKLAFYSNSKFKDARKTSAMKIQEYESLTANRRQISICVEKPIIAGSWKFKALGQG